MGEERKKNTEGGIGRRVLTKVGLALFGVSSVALAFCNDIHLFWVLRAVQAFTGAAATVVVPGIIRHIYKQDTAKGMSYVSMIMMVAPLIAPTVGSMIMGLSHWQTIFLRTSQLQLCNFSARANLPH